MEEATRWSAGWPDSVSGTWCRLRSKNVGVGEVPRRLSTATRPVRWMAAHGAVAPVTGSDGGEAKWVHDVSELL
jgi:hypothetical protein